MVRSAGILLSLAAIVLGAAAPLQAAGDPVDIPTSLVVDPCRFHTSAEGDVTSETALFDIPIGQPLEEIAWASADSGHYRGAAWATLPGYEKSHLFLSRDRYIEVYDLDTPIEFAGIPNGANAVNVVDVAQLAGIPGFEIGRIAAGRYLGFEVEPGVVVGASALYLIGTAGSTGHYVVVDQEFLIDWDPSSPNPIVHATGPICQSGSCVTLDAIDLAVGDLAGPGYSEEAYITVVQDFSGTELALTYRLERSLAGDAFSASQVFGYLWGMPEVPESSGLAFADDSHDVYVLRKPSFVRNLADGSESCALAGEPTDVAIWEPGAASAVSRYLFVTSSDGATGRVEIVPAASCSNGGSVAHTITTLAEPTSLDLYVVGNTKVVVLVATQGQAASQGGYESFVVSLDVAGGVDTFKTLNRRSLDMTYGGYFTESCPSEVAVGVRRGLVGRKPKGLDRRCLPGDPRCPPP